MTIYFVCVTTAPPRQDREPDERVPDERPGGGPAEAVHHCRAAPHEEDAGSAAAAGGEWPNMRAVQELLKIAAFRLIL